MGGEESTRAHTEEGQPKQRKIFVCSGYVIVREFLESNVAPEVGWKLGVDPTRFAVQYGVTTQAKKAEPWTNWR